MFANPILKTMFGLSRRDPCDSRFADSRDYSR